ncbi:MAG TPA: YidB family protein [Gemmatimonadaceae bacterium]
MGLLDNVTGKANEIESAIQQGSEHAGLMGHVTDFVHAHPGGLAGLVQTFREKGLGDVVNSWISRERNQPVTAAQIESVLGNDTVQALAAKVGVSTSTIATGLATVLPQVVDKLTPQGTLPAASGAPAAPEPEPPRATA